jgi:ABC-type antimicrobial peptide transport system permease subunit
MGDGALPSMAILAQTVGPPLTVVSDVQTAVAQVDADQPVYGLRPLEFLVASEFDLNRLSMALLALFAAVALVLAVAGISGVVTHSVGQRLREIGLRMALGALAGDVLRLIVGESARWALLGMAAGLVLAGLLAERLAALTPGWSGTDWRVLALAAVVVLAATLVSAWLPARRAAALDPARALRSD